jgi:hypothetical protein
MPTSSVVSALQGSSRTSIGAELCLQTQNTFTFTFSPREINKQFGVRQGSSQSDPQLKNSKKYMSMLAFRTMALHPCSQCKEQVEQGVLKVQLLQQRIRNCCRIAYCQHFTT